MRIRDDLTFTRIGADDTAREIIRPVAAETPVAIEYNGIGYAVLMATPADLEDLAFGFTRSERLAASATDIVAVDPHSRDDAILLRITLADPAPVAERVRHRIAESGCGLCGIENLEQALRPLPRAIAGARICDAAIFAAYGALRDNQPLNAATGAVHAAALCAADGAIRLVREDVGRHNAFDKLLGAMIRGGLAWAGGFALLSSRCSYELVEKAVLGGCPTLVTVSAPTTLAIARAAEAGLPLRVLARSDAFLAS